MSTARGIGPTGRIAMYAIPDNELAVGSTLGGPRVAAIIKANGAIAKVFSVDAGLSLFGTVILRHYEASSGMVLAATRPGTVYLHPEHQVHEYELPLGVRVRETIFVLSGPPGEDGSVDPPGVYQLVELRNEGFAPIELVTYVYAVLRGETEHDLETRFDRGRRAIVAWNRGKPEQARLFGVSVEPESWETTVDYGQAVRESCPGTLSGRLNAGSDPLGVFQLRHRLKPGQEREFAVLLSCGRGRREAAANFRACPPARQALDRTKGYYQEVLNRAVVLTPDTEVNRGVLWAKANMLRVQVKAPTGWGFTNDPTRSNNTVARDTAWYCFGADYLTPEFARAALLGYTERQEKSGMIVEYYDLRTGKTADYGLNINDNTPLLIMALWHHYNATGDEEFLRTVYPRAVKAARYMLSQRNEQGLVWCTADGTSDWGIIGWRNVIPNYRLSGATTEVNSEAYAALGTVAGMARVMGEHEQSAEFLAAAAELREAINRHLYDPDSGLYYLNIDLDGRPRSNVTSDLVFPLMFGVAGDHVAEHIISRLSNADFWTAAGIRTAPRDAPEYTPEGGWGLLGGVWVGVSYWYAFAAAPYSPDFMARALSTSFRIYSDDPRGHNTVPGQFSEWLNGETLVNQGMMLSPWFPPRYLWAAVEGMAGFKATEDAVEIAPHLAPEWKWMSVQRLPYRGRRLTWFVARMPDVHIFGNFFAPTTGATFLGYEEDISAEVTSTGDDVCAGGLRRGATLLLFAGNTAEETRTTSLRLLRPAAGTYRRREYNSMFKEWYTAPDPLTPEDLAAGITVKLERKGFCLLELHQET